LYRRIHLDKRRNQSDTYVQDLMITKQRLKLFCAGSSHVLDVKILD